MNSGDIGASDIWVIVKVTPCVAIDWLPGATQVTVAFE